MIVRFTSLKADEDVLLARVRTMTGHYMKSNAQMKLWEESDMREQRRDVLEVDSRAEGR